MKAFLVFLIVLIILALFAWRGWRRGMVLTIIGIMVFTVAYAGGNLMAKRLAGQFSHAITPLLSSPVEDACRVAIGLEGRKTRDEKGNKITLDPVTPAEFDGTVESAAYLSFREIGFAKDSSEKFAKEIASEVDSVGNSMYVAISEKVALVVTFLMVFVFTAVIIIIAASALANLFNLSVEFPGYNKVNRIGGAVFGLFFGLVVLFGIGWLLKFSGVIFKDVLENTVIGKFTVNNPFTHMMGF